MTDLDDLLDETPAPDEPEQEDTEEDADEEALRKAAASAQREEEEDTQALIRRIRSMEAQGREDKNILADLERRGISRQAAMRAWQQHVEDFPEHGHEEAPQLPEQESLEERVGDAPRNQEQTNPLYDLQSRVSEASDQELYDALSQAETYITSRGGVTDNEYEALNTFEEELARRRGGPGYESSDVVENIKNVGRLRMGDSYLGNDNQSL